MAEKFVVDKAQGNATRMCAEWNGNAVGRTVSDAIQAICRGGRVENTTEGGKAVNAMLSALDGASKNPKTKAGKQINDIPTADKVEGYSRGTPGGELASDFLAGLLKSPKPPKNTLTRKAQRSLTDSPFGVSLENFLGVEQPAL
jgi:hypothetical protein